jgi:uncharacterized membrane protein YoaK (UPF0700 family)
MISWQIAVFLIIKFVLANLAWVSHSVFFIKPLPAKSPVLWRLLQWLIYLVVAFMLSLWIENFLMGVIYQQDWEFYVTFLCVFIVFSFPGFIYQLYRKNNR